MADETHAYRKVRIRPRWQRRLVRFFSRAEVELAIGALILVSVTLTLIEFSLAHATSEPSKSLMESVQQANAILTGLFVVELSLRLVAIMSVRRFFREYWIDLLAVLPSLLPDLGWTRLMRLIRLLRILRLFGFVSRFSSNFPYILRRGASEYLTVAGTLLMTVVLATGAMVLFERRLAPGDAFWFSLYSLFAGEPIPQQPESLGGKIVSVFVMFMGLTIFAMFTGTVSAFMVERLRTKGRVVDWEQIADHVVICGWNSKAQIILQEFLVSQSTTPLVVICQWEHEPPNLSPKLESRVVFLQDDFTRVVALERAGILRAKTCIIVSDTWGGRSEQDADARTILAALTVEKLNPAVYTCAELNNRDYASHLKMGHVNDYVVSTEYGAYLLAQAAMNRGLMDVITELLTYQRGNQFYRIELPESWVGRRFDELLLEMKEKHHAILVAVHPAGGSIIVNPESYACQPGDHAVVIATRELKL